MMVRNHDLPLIDRHLVTGGPRIRPSTIVVRLALRPYTYAPREKDS